MSEKLPAGWKWTTLTEVVGDSGVFVDGDWIESKDQDPGGDVRLIQLADIGDGNFKNKSARFLTLKRAKEIKCTFLLDGDILVARMPDPIGRACIFPLKGKDKYVTAVDVAIIRPDNNIIDSKYLLYSINNPKYRNAIEDLESGTTRKRISRKNLSTLQFSLPSKPIQQAIVSKIEELFSELDKGIENLRLVQQQIKTYRQSVLKWAFEGRLTNGNVKEGELPEGWTMVKTIDVIKTINNGYTPTSQYLSQGSGEVPFIKVYNLNFDGTLNFKKNPTFIPDATHKKDLKRSICLPGDVLINIVGPPLGKVSVVSTQYPEWNINQAIVMFRPNENVLSKYISYFMQSSVTINWLENTSKATAGQWNVKVSTCREIPFPYCSFEEQNDIVKEIESRLSVADKIEESISQSLQQAEALRQSILKKAFEGKFLIEKEIAPYKPKSEYFYQMQVLGLIAKASKSKNIKHGEMTIAKYAYLVDKVYKIPTYYNYERWHLGPYPPEMKKAINNKSFFKLTGGDVLLTDENTLFKYNNPNTEIIESAVNDLALIFSKYPEKERAHKTELLATVCKVVEDIKAADLVSVRNSMLEWPINLKTSSIKNKAEKFTEAETKKCLEFLSERGWDKLLNN